MKIPTHLPLPYSVMQNDAGETTLYIVPSNNLPEVFNYLLKFSDLETVEISSKSDFNAFHIASKFGHLGMVNELLRLWPELCKVCDTRNTSPLYCATVNDRLDVVNAMLDAFKQCNAISEGDCEGKQKEGD